MTSDLTVRDSVISDVYRLADNLRRQDADEIARVDMTPRMALRKCFKESLFYRKTALVGTTVAAMWGCSGNLLADTGRTYLLTSPESVDIGRFAFVRLYRNEVDRMLELFPTLTGLVDNRYDEAIKLLRLVGFEVTDFDDKFFRYTKRR